MDSNDGLSAELAGDIARDYFGVTGASRPLVGWANQNFLIEVEGGKRFVLKLSQVAADRDGRVAAQHAALDWLMSHAPDLQIPRVVQATNGESAPTIAVAGQQCVARMLTYLEGETLAAVKAPPQPVFRAVGELLGAVDVALRDFAHPGAKIRHEWDLANALDVIEKYKESIPVLADRHLLDRMVSRVRVGFAEGIAMLPRSVIHSDGNDHNIIVDVTDETPVVTGLIDFGDLVETCTVFEPAIAATYAMLSSDTPLEVAAELIRGYHNIQPLQTQEIDVLYHAVVLRLCVSVCLSAHRSARDPTDKYLTVSEAPAWNLLQRLESVSPYIASEIFRTACGVASATPEVQDTPRVAAARAAHIGPNLSISYRDPLQIVRGSMQYLYDAEGREYLDTVNNVCHVGHCHPRVVHAAQQQLARLNTNTRYLNDLLGEYAKRLCATLPPQLEVCYFVCSGSEANELALRMARTHTGNHDVVVVDGAYHGNTSSLIDLSPYKHNRPGGAGTPSFVQVAAIPDVYRGPNNDSVTAGKQYALDVADRVEAIKRRGQRPAAFFCESVPSCAGQVVLPTGYLENAYRVVREAGGVCVADEVQVGFGRAGSHFWGFELQDVVPDIVTMGKPIGNGHPMAAVVTTVEIATSFDNGMEYFNTFGGNPVSCAIGMAVLEVIHDEHLQDNAHTVGQYFREALSELINHHPLIGDVRGVGLFLGVELVRDRATKEPATREAKDVTEHLKSNGILASTDGPFDNVLKIKPPLCFTKANADSYVSAISKSLGVLEPSM